MCQADCNAERFLKALAEPLRRPFIERAIPGLQVDWDSLLQRRVSFLLNAVKECEPTAREAFGRTIYWIRRIANTKNCVNSLGMLLRKNGFAPPDGFEVYSALDKTVYTFVTLSSQTWAELYKLTLWQIEHPHSDWLTLKLKLDEHTYNPTAEAIEQFRKQVCEMFSGQEFRGGHGQCEMKVDAEEQKDHFVLYQNDHAQQMMEWQGEEVFSEQEITPAFEALVIYDRLTHILCICAGTTGKNRREIGRIWAEAFLGMKKLKIDKTAPYNVQIFADYTRAEFPQSCGRILGVRLVSLSTKDPETPTSRRVFDEPPSVDVIATAIRELTASGRHLCQMCIRKITFMVDYLTESNAISTLRFHVSEKTSDFVSFPEYEQKIIRQFLLELGVLNAI